MDDVDAVTSVGDAAAVNVLGRRLLEMDPEPIPRFRILRDVLELAPEHPDYVAAQQAIMAQRHVQALCATQLPDGTWGRFHSQDASSRAPFPTTEYAIERALALGLDGSSDLLQGTVAFLAAHLGGRKAWPDRAEKHDDPRLWCHNTPLISAAYLAWLDPHHPALAASYEIMRRVAAAAFASGAYDRAAELRAHAKLAGFTSLRFRPSVDKYALMLFGAMPGGLPAALEEALLAHVLTAPTGVYYAYPRRMDDPPSIGVRGFTSWLNTVAILCRFPGWRRHGAQAVDWLWCQRGASGLWDFGARVAGDPASPLSGNWRRAQGRAVDSSLRVLAVLRASVGPPA